MYILIHMRHIDACFDSNASSMYIYKYIMYTMQPLFTKTYYKTNAILIQCVPLSYYLSCLFTCTRDVFNLMGHGNQ